MQGEKRENICVVQAYKTQGRKINRELGRMLKSRVQLKKKVDCPIAIYFLASYVLPLDYILKKFHTYITKTGSIFGEYLQKFFRWHSRSVPTD